MASSKHHQLRAPKTDGGKRRDSGSEDESDQKQWISIDSWLDSHRRRTNATRSKGRTLFDKGAARARADAHEARRRIAKRRPSSGSGGHGAVRGSDRGELAARVRNKAVQHARRHVYADARRPIERPRPVDDRARSDFVAIEAADPVHSGKRAAPDGLKAKRATRDDGAQMAKARPRPTTLREEEQQAEHTPRPAKNRRGSDNDDARDPKRRPIVVKSRYIDAGLSDTQAAEAKANAAARSRKKRSAKVAPQAQAAAPSQAAAGVGRAKWADSRRLIAIPSVLVTPGNGDYPENDGPRSRHSRHNGSDASTVDYANEEDDDGGETQLARSASPAAVRCGFGPAAAGCPWIAAKRNAKARRGKHDADAKWAGSSKQEPARPDSDEDDSGNEANCSHFSGTPPCHSDAAISDTSGMSDSDSQASLTVQTPLCLSDSDDSQEEDKSAKGAPKRPTYHADVSDCDSQGALASESDESAEPRPNRDNDSDEDANSSSAVDDDSDEGPMPYLLIRHGPEHRNAVYKVCDAELSPSSRGGSFCSCRGREMSIAAMTLAPAPPPTQAHFGAPWLGVPGAHTISAAWPPAPMSVQRDTGTPLFQHQATSAAYPFAVAQHAAPSQQRPIWQFAPAVRLAPTGAVQHLAGAAAAAVVAAASQQAAPSTTATATSAGLSAAVPPPATASVAQLARPQPAAQFGVGLGPVVPEHAPLVGATLANVSKALDGLIDKSTNGGAATLRPDVEHAVAACRAYLAERLKTDASASGPRLSMVENGDDTGAIAAFVGRALPACEPTDDVVQLAREARQAIAIGS